MGVVGIFYRRHHLPAPHGDVYDQFDDGRRAGARTPIVDRCSNRFWYDRYVTPAKEALNMMGPLPPAGSRTHRVERTECVTPPRAICFRPDPGRDLIIMALPDRFRTMLLTDHISLFSPPENHQSRNGLTMMRTSRSRFSPSARLFVPSPTGAAYRAQEDGIPSHTASSMIAAKAIARQFAGDIRPGDVFIINDAYTGGTHLPDLTVIKPIFVDGEMMFMAINRAHHEDIGGMTAGSYSPMATEIFHEGIRVPPLRICRDNRPIRDVVEMVKINTRLPEMLWSDIRAQIASCDVAEARLISMVAEYGRDTMKAVMEDIQEYAERQTRGHCAMAFTGEAIPDNDGFDSSGQHSGDVDRARTTTPTSPAPTRRRAADQQHAGELGHVRPRRAAYDHRPGCPRVECLPAVKIVARKAVWSTRRHRAV